MKSYTFKVLLIACCLFTSFAARAQNPPGPLSPDGLFDKVFDMYGNSYSLEDLRIDTTIIRTRGGQPLDLEILCMSSGYFNVWFETGSGFEGSSPTAVARRNVICQLFQDISNFIVPADPTNKVNIWVRDISTLVSNPSSSGVLGLASSFYTVPTGAPAVSGIVDGEIWKTINSGEDSYTNVTSPLITQGGFTLGFYHGIMAFNFANPSINWHTNLGTTTTTGLYDLYSVALHEVTHALGFASLINFDGTSKLGTNYDYYSRYDMFLQTQGGDNLITNLGCPLYNFSFNPLLNPNSVLSPNPATCSFNIPYNGSLDNTSCTIAIKFNGPSVNQSVYTPDCFEPPSSLSHLEDQCRTPTAFPNNTYYNMSNATGTGFTYMKRFPKFEERRVLCDIGYKVNDSYGNMLNTANYTTYTGGVCPGLLVAGINDGINNLGAYSIVTTSGTPVNFSGILGNDFGASTFTCLEEVYGNGNVSTSNGNNSTVVTFTPDPGYAGIALLRYIPWNGANKGNITYIYISVNSASCVATPCDMVMNGTFESGANCGQMATDLPLPIIDCWYRLTATPDYYVRGCVSPNFPGLTVPATGMTSDPPTESWSGPGTGNDRFTGMMCDNLVQEAIQTTLTTPIQPNASYTLSFWSKVSNNHIGAVDGPATVTFRGDISVLGQVSWIPFNTLGTFLQDTIIEDDSLWHFNSLNFTYTGVVPLNALFVGNTSSNPTYIFIDDVKLVPFGQITTFTPPDTVCIGTVLMDLSQYVNPAGGTFSGTGVTFNNGIYTFTAGSAGLYTIVYTYVDNLGCTVNVPTQILVTNDIAPSISISASPSNPPCANEPVTLTASGASTYTWTPAVSCTPPCSVAVVSPSSTTTYIATGTGSNGCISTAAITLLVTHPALCCSIANYVIPNNALASSYAIPPGSIIDVLGNFIIDVNVSYTSCYFRMLPGSRMTVNSVNSLTFNGCALFSCTDMWDGIYLIQSGTQAADLTLFNSSLEDAINGIVANSNFTIYGSNIVIDNSRLNKNYYSIKLDNYIGFSGPYPIDIRASEFTCAASPLSFGNTLKAPHLNERSYAAIRIDSVDMVTIGNTSNVNTVDSVINHDFGVYATFSMVNVYHFVFYSMAAATVNCPFPLPCPPQPGVAVFVPDVAQSNKIINVGGTIGFQPNRFVDVRRGIQVENIRTLNAQNNFFWCTTTPTTWTVGNKTSEYGIMAEHISNTFNVQNNALTNFSTSIQLRRNNSTGTTYNPVIQVLSNHVNTFGTGYVSRGIDLIDVSANSITTVNTIQVYDNNLTDIRNFGISCVYFKNRPRISGTFSQSQDVTMRYNASGTYYGIYLQGCDSAIVNNNEIRSTNKSNINMHGIYIRDSRNNRVQCNQVYTIGNAVSFEGSCLSPYITPTFNRGVVSNTFWNTQVGINLRNSAVMGQQGDPSHPSGNTWLGAAGTYNLGQTRTDATSNPGFSTIYCRALVLSEWPTNHTTSGGTAYANSVTVVNASGTKPSCPGPAGAPGEPMVSIVEDKGSDRTIYSKTAASVDIKIYPNPADHNVTISAAEVSGKMDVEVVDMLGRRWTTASLNNEGGTYQLNTAALPPGFYILNMTGSGKYLGSVHLQIAR